MSETSIALVTGGASGIGRATAEAFLRKGYKVAIVDRDEATGRTTTAGFETLGDCRFFLCDVSDEHQVDATFEQVVGHFGRIDAAFNAAGIDGERNAVADYSTAGWDAIMNTNLRGLFFCLRREIAQMLRQGGGAIVNCASSSGLMGAPTMSAYVASKHGVVGLTKAAALENARTGIRINAVCPGMIYTPMWQRSISPELTEQLLKTDPAGRLGRPEEIAAAVLWLCDNEAASFVNGHSMSIDGGMTVM
jgi:NAD(P)-dependent dehydrogenase (short-subunit alcohol dehydrogenase family)